MLAWPGIASVSVLAAKHVRMTWQGIPPDMRLPRRSSLPLQAHFSIENKQGFCDIGVMHPTSVAPRESRHFVCMGPARAVRKVTLQVGSVLPLLLPRLLQLLHCCRGAEACARSLVWGLHDAACIARIQCRLLLLLKGIPAPLIPALCPLLPPQPGEVWVGDAAFTAHDEYWPLAPWEVEDPSCVPVRESSPEFLPGWSRARRSASVIGDDDL